MSIVLSPRDGAAEMTPSQEVGLDMSNKKEYLLDV